MKSILEIGADKSFDRKSGKNRKSRVSKKVMSDWWIIRLVELGSCENHSTGFELSSSQWNKIKELLPGKLGEPGRSGVDTRCAVNGVLWVLRSGSPWHDLPERYGNWRNVHTRFIRWGRAGVWDRVFARLLDDLDHTNDMLNRSSSDSEVKVNQKVL